MPELPDLVYIEKNLSGVLVNRTISQVHIKEPIVLRVLVDSSFEQGLTGAVVQKIYRHGPFLCFGFDTGLELIIHPMLAGRFKIAAGKGRGRGLCFSMITTDGLTCSYLDGKRMGKVYLTKVGQYDGLPRFETQGIDILSAAFSEEAFRKIFRGQRKQVRVFLMDQTLLSAVGNAYADEILFTTGIHPKTFCYQLSEADVERLYRSINETIRWGIEAVENAAQSVEIKVRGHMKVRNRKDQPCPVCCTTIRRTGVLGHDSFFCPTCQPARRDQFIQWT